MTEVLIVAALHEEIAPLEQQRAYPNRARVVTGPGKVNAASGLAANLRPGVKLVINLGTAGRVNEDVPLFEPIEVTWLTEWDTDLKQIGDHLYEDAERWGRDIKLNETGRTTCATGDRFVSDPVVRDALQQRGVDLVDMEAYAYAKVCRLFGVDFRCVKVAVDDLDIDTWRERLARGADVLDAWFRSNVA